MIRLRPDFQVSETPDNNASAATVREWITMEVAGGMVPFLDESMLEEVAHGILHYFKQDLGMEAVSAEDFARALEQVMKGFGVEVTACHVETGAVETFEADLCGLAKEASQGLELAFFPRLRAEVRRQMEQASPLLRFHGLRRCVKQIVGAKRWSARCQKLNDHIIDYLRSCLNTEKGKASCAMIVQ